MVVLSGGLATDRACWAVGAERRNRSPTTRSKRRSSDMYRFCPKR